MRTPEVISIAVVEHDGKKLFLGKERRHVAPAWGPGLVETPEGYLYHEVYIGRFGSWCPYDATVGGREKEVDTPCLLFRKGEFFDATSLAYFGSQSDGYHILETFKRIGNPMKTNAGPRVYMAADWFDVGDIIAFVRMPSAREVEKATGRP